MFIVALACVLLLALTTVTHYEALSSLNTRLVSLAIPNRSKLLVVISTAFMAHALEMTLYGLTIYLLTKYFGVGALSGPSGKPGPVGHIGEHAVPVVGRVSMDLITVDVTDVPPNLAARGAWVEVMGARTTIDDLTDRAGTIGYELLTRLGQRVHRIYLGA